MLTLPRAVLHGGAFPSSKAKQKSGQELLGFEGRGRASSLAQCAFAAIAPCTALATGHDASTTLNTKKKKPKQNIADNLHLLRFNLH